jgi:[CysO sulfur-carrier protein]-S-L-cysteine hydrolase
MPTSTHERVMIEFDGVLFKEIVEQGLREFPNECCGVVASTSEGRPVKVYPVKNIDASPATYRLDGKEQLRISEEIEERGWETWGFYHSHTHSEASPSQTDRDRAFYPETRYLIVSLQDRDEPVLCSFFIQDGEVTEEELQIT